MPSFFRKHGPDGGELTMDRILDEVLGVVDRVVRHEKELSSH
jgi:hypothetical protein